MGKLILVVGPSGTGKDSLINFARNALGENEQFHFPRRNITREADPGGENHIPCTTDKFEEMDGSGAFFLSWRAHTAHYGIPMEILDRLKSGQSIIVNVSRSVIPQARELWPNVLVINIKTPEHILKKRLAERGRETPEEIENRVAKANNYNVFGPGVVTLLNDSDLESAIQKFMHYVTQPDVAAQ